ncbi:hypothetical protein OXX80_001711 [Metschnikowia pulcherrima]
MFRNTTKLVQPGFKLTTRPAQLSTFAIRTYSVKTKAKNFNKFLDRIGDEKTAVSQKTIKAVRMVGAGSIILVICSLFWASSLTAPVKETPVDMGNLTHDVRDR